MTATVYDITIAGIGGSGTATGFIDPKTVYVYMEAGSNPPASYTTSLSKCRGNRRYKHILFSLESMTNTYVTALTPTGGTVDAAPSALVIRIEVEQGDDALITRDEDNAGQFLTGALAIKRCVSRALIRDETRLMEVLDPTAATAPGNNTSFARTGPRMNVETVGKLAANIAAADSSITVTKIS